MDQREEDHGDVFVFPVCVTGPAREQSSREVGILDRGGERMPNSWAFIHVSSTTSRDGESSASTKVRNMFYTE